MRRKKSALVQCGHIPVCCTRGIAQVHFIALVCGDGTLGAKGTLLVSGKGIQALLGAALVALTKTYLCGADAGYEPLVPWNRGLVDSPLVI